MNKLLRRFKDYWTIGLACAVGLAFFLLSRERLEAQLEKGAAEAVLCVCVLAVSILWMLLFIRATLEEPELLRDQKVLEKVDAKKLSRMVTGQAFGVMVVLSLGFGGLIASVTYPITYCVIAVLIQITDCLGVAAIQRTLFEVYLGETAPVPPLYVYYMYKPQFIVRVARLLGLMSALALAVAARLPRHSSLELVSSGLITLTILSGEFVMWLWRRWLNNQTPG